MLFKNKASQKDLDELKSIVAKLNDKVEDGIGELESVVDDVREELSRDVEELEYRLDELPDVDHEFRNVWDEIEIHTRKIRELTEKVEELSSRVNATVKPEKEFLPSGHPYKETLVQIDGIEGEFKAFTCGILWNGFECPEFTKESAMKFIEAYNESEIGMAFYDEEFDTFFFINTNDNFNVSDKFSGGFNTILNMKVYDIGHSSWCWSEVVND